MVEDSEALSGSSSDLINAICLYYDQEYLISIIVNALLGKQKNIKVITAALEVLVVLLKEDQKYCLNNANVLETSLKVTEILEEHQSNMDIIMPSIAALLALRDKNFEGTMKALVFLKSPTLILLRKLSS